jgi:hypothetical protein
MWAAFSIGRSMRRQGDTLHEMRRGSGATGESEPKLWLYPEP